MLTAENVSVRTPDGRTLLTGLCFRLRPGRTLVIQGPNGIGKTTLLRACLGEHGLLDGMLKKQVATGDTAYLPQLQNTELHLPLTLREVLQTELMPAAVAENVTVSRLMSPAVLDRAWNSASGGERQKTLLLRALLQQKKLLVLDEPMNHLDSNARVQVAAVLADYTKDEGRSLIVVSHESENAAFFPDADILKLTDYLP
jgi:ABC-type Mn2+/Zn2+ transport system ATPase subunit